MTEPQPSSRRQSIYSPASGYGEIVFDSRSGCSSQGSAFTAASGASAVSGASGRRGPLSALARAGMKAVKAVGACWRCKFLRKQVNDTLTDLTW